LRIWPLRPRPAFGRQAEILAAEHLRKREGYLLLACPYRAPRGEIDIVARDGEMLVFVEVKARRTDPHPEDAVTLPKQRRIANAAAAFRQENPRYRGAPYRFDVVAVVWPAGERPRVSLRKDAFRRPGRRD
jgi:putative endonuclease